MENMEFPSFEDFNEIGLLGNVNNTMVHNETAANPPKEMNLGDPTTFTEASMMPKTPADVEGKLPSPLATNDQPQLDQTNANPDTFGFGNEQVVDQLLPSPGMTPSESFFHDVNSNPNLGQPMYSGNNGSSLGPDVAAHQPTLPDFSALIMEPTHSFPMALAEKLPQDGAFSTQPVHSVQVNQVNGQTGGSLQADQFQMSQRVETANPANNNLQQALPHPNIFPQTSSGIGYVLGGSAQINQQTPPNWLPYRSQNNFYRPLAPSGTQQLNQFQATGSSDPQNHNFALPRLSAPLRPQQLNSPLQLIDQVNQAPAVSNMPNASNSFLQNSMLNKQSMPQLMPQHFSNNDDQAAVAPGAYSQQTYGTRLPESASIPLRSQNFSYQNGQLGMAPGSYNQQQTYSTRLTESSVPLRPQNFSYQHDQVGMAPRTYNQQTYGTKSSESSMPLRHQNFSQQQTRFPESSMSSRTPMLPPLHQINVLDTSDSQYRNSQESRGPMLPTAGFTVQDSNDDRNHQFNQFNPITNRFGTQSSNSMLQQSQMNSGNSSSYQLPPPPANNQFSMMSGLSNVDHHNSNVLESSLLPRNQQHQQQRGLFNQTPRPIPTYPACGAAMSSTVLNSLLERDTGSDASAPQQGNSSRRRGPRSRFELGDSSSSFKRFRRESTMAPLEPSTAQQDNNTSFLPLRINEASTSSNTDNLGHPRQVRNSLYDPLFEGLGLPVDPHLRLFATTKEGKSSMNNNGRNPEH